MRISDVSFGRLAALALIALAGMTSAVAVTTCPVVAAQPAVKYRTAEDAINQGLSAYNGNYFEIAIPALEYAAKNGSDVESFLARYYLGRIFSDNSGVHTDHARAFDIFQHLADEHADIDSDADPRARFVGKALVALAHYNRIGLAELGISPDARRAAEYLQHAATMFGDEDAQFELAKLYLKGEGVEKNVPKAKHWLASLSQRGHPGAQAFLADLFWRGKIIEKDQVKALALITISVANAPLHERVWIEDIYQNIYCGAAEGVRTQATGLVADWRTRYGRRARPDTRDNLGALDVEPERTCTDGQRIAPYSNGRFEPAGERIAKPAPSSKPDTREAGFATGSTLGGATLDPGSIGGPAPSTAAAGGFGFSSSPGLGGR